MDDQALAVVRYLERRGPTRVRRLLDETALCESDLHGCVTTCRAAGLVRETTVDGERGYETTARATDLVARLEDAAAEK
jgi:predicted transcriptional regulator